MSLLHLGSNALIRQAFQSDAPSRQDLAFDSNAISTQALQSNAKASASLKTEINPPPPPSFSYKLIKRFAILIASLFLIGCGGGGGGGGSSGGTGGGGGGGGGSDSGDGGGGNPVVVNAQTPIITDRPQGATYTIGAPASLSVGASVTDGGDLTYQWYSNSANLNSDGSAIGGATTATYAPSTAAEGITYYYVVVTNTNNNANGVKTATATSETARIEVNGVINAQAPIIIAQPKSVGYILGSSATPLSVTATSPDAGTLSYQWYSNTINSNSGGTEISGAITASYTPPINTAGTKYYYVVVTNTNNNAYGNKTESVASAAVSVIVDKASVYFYDSELNLLGEFHDLPATPIDLEANKSAYSGVTIYNWYLGGSNKPSTNNPYTLTNLHTRFYATPNVVEITDQTGLNSVRYGLSGKYILLNDITLQADKAGFDATLGWEPIGDNLNSFTGIFSGNNHKIINLWIDRTDTYYIGLFGYIARAQIKNLGVEIAGGKSVRGDEYVGGIAGQVFNDSSIADSFVIGNVSGSSVVGGIAGIVFSGGSNITNSYSTGAVSGSGTGGSVGGIAGRVQNGAVINSYSTGAISGTNWYIGGIAGQVLSGSITNSRSSGAISGTSGVGGIAGHIGATTTDGGSFISNSYSTGAISLTTGGSVGGIAGGVNGGSTITNSYSTGAISGSGTNAAVAVVGGIVGTLESGSITNNYSTGAISGMSDGGIAGWVENGSSTIQNNAAINPSVNRNRIVSVIYSGNGAPTISNNIALSTMKVNGVTVSDDAMRNGTGKSDTELKTDAPYRDLNWDFTNIWKIPDGGGYPILRWQSE